MDIIPDQRSSAVLTKSDSDLEMYDIIDRIIDNIIDDIVFEDESNKLYKHVRIKSNLSILTKCINILYYCFIRYNLYFYNRYFEVDSISCKVSNVFYNMNKNSVIIYDSCIQLNNKINIPYEYIKTIHCKSNISVLELIPNEKNITIIQIQSNKARCIFNKIEKNMNYHVRYHKLNNKAIKYYQKLHKVPLEVY